MKIKIQELTHEDLVNIFASVYDMYEYFHIEVVNKPQFDDSECECREDTWAEVLLNGGTLAYIDHEDDDNKYVFDLSLAKRRLGKSVAINYLTKFLMGESDAYNDWQLIQVMAFGDAIYG